MIPFLNSPVKLEVLPAESMPGQHMSSSADGQVHEFAGIMANISSESADSGEALPGGMQKLLGQLGLDQQQMQSLQQFIGNGKNLPHAAQQMLSELQVLSQADAMSAEDMAKALETLQVLIDKLPPAARQQFAPVISGLEQLSAQTRAEVEQTENTAEHEDIGEEPIALAGKLPQQRNEKAADIEHKLQVTDGKPAVSEADTAVATENTETVEIIPPVSAQSSDKPSERTHIPAAVSQAGARNTQAVNVNQANERSPAFYPQNYGESVDPEVTADTKEVLVNIKTNAANNRNSLNLFTAAKMNPAILQSQSASAQGAAFSGNEGQGFMNSQGQQTGGTSFLQMMAQASPAAITQNIHKPEWGSAVGERISWMIGNRMQSAKLHITPAHLGPIEMKINIEKNAAHVSFVSDHQVVRNALEQAVPKLRDMLQEQELDLVDVDIHEKDQQQSAFSEQLTSQDSAPGDQNNRNQLADENDQDIDSVEKPPQIVSSALLDTFA